MPLLLQLPHRLFCLRIVIFLYSTPIIPAKNSAFSGKTHEVYTAFAVLQGEKAYAEAVATAVTFRALSDHEIDYYIQKEAPYDKAGAYGIQELAGIFVEKIEGNFDNVVGLPLCQLETAFKREFGLSLFAFAKA